MRGNQLELTSESGSGDSEVEGSLKGQSKCLSLENLVVSSFCKAVEEPSVFALGTIYELAAVLRTYAVLFWLSWQ